MSLFNIDGAPQNAVGHKDYWNNFRRFRNTPLHSEFVREINNNLNTNFIDSLQLGSRIITKIEKENLSLYNQESADEIGSLFGMTLWNVLAEDSENWKFLMKSIDSFDNAKGTQYFK
ncbi:MAG TPA: hypothetical protein VIL99_06215 [Ignavibacteria bacterium]